MIKWWLIPYRKRVSVVSSLCSSDWAGLTRWSSCSFLWTDWPSGSRSRPTSSPPVRVRWRTWWCRRRPAWQASAGLQLRVGVVPSPPWKWLIEFNYTFPLWVCVLSINTSRISRKFIAKLILDNCSGKIDLRENQTKLFSRTLFISWTKKNMKRISYLCCCKLLAKISMCAVSDKPMLTVLCLWLDVIWDYSRKMKTIAILAFWVLWKSYNSVCYNSIICVQKRVSFRQFENYNK